jgi:F0F1-type ATP synthase assembly protein I
MLDPDFLRQAGPAAALSIQLVIMTLGGLWVGQELDTRFQSDPWLLLLFTCVGFAVGLFTFVRVLGSFQDDEEPPSSGLD